MVRCSVHRCYVTRIVRVDVQVGLVMRCKLPTTNMSKVALKRCRPYSRKHRTYAHSLKITSPMSHDVFVTTVGDDAFAPVSSVSIFTFESEKLLDLQVSKIIKAD